MNTTNFFPEEEADCQACSIRSAKAFSVLNLPPSGPDPMKSVSQNLQMALERSFSWPDHRLQPAKRQKTAARPV